MRQLPERMYDDLLDQRIRTQLDSQYEALNLRLRLLESPTTASVQYSASPNMLPNSHPEWSTLAYGTPGTTPATAGDTNYECYNWKYQTSATTNLSASASPLLASGHSGYAGLNADAPVWDRTNGTFRLGSSSTNYDICAPLPTDFVYPGMKFYVYFEASVNDADTDIGDAEFYCGFWDDTAGQEKWIEGSAFTPTISVYGTTGARTLEYKILAETDAGDQILSSAVSTASAPSTLSTSNHVRLNFSGAPGFIRYVIYRKDGSNYYRVGEIRNSIDLQFFDIIESGDTVVPVSGYPSITTTTPKAYALTIGFEPGDAGSFQAHTMTIQVPLTYNRANTGNLQQYFRFGLNSLLSSSNYRREVIIRRISVSEGYGQWSRSPLDLQAASGPSSAAVSAPAGGGGTTTTPPTGGGGGPLCLTLDTEIDVPNGVKLIANIDKGDEIECQTVFAVTKTKVGTVQFVWEIELEDGKKVKCSDSHRFITNKGKPKSAGKLTVGESLLTREGESKIVKKQCLVGQWKVKQISLPFPHLFISNGIISHNRKLPTDELPQDPGA